MLPLLLLICTGVLSHHGDSPMLVRHESGAAASVPEGAAIARLEGEVLRLRSAKFLLDPKRLDLLLERIADARLESELHPELTKRCAAALLDLLGAYLGDEEAPGRETPEERVVDAVLDSLRPKLDADLSRWLASEVLPVQSLPVERRRAAARLFRDRPAPIAKYALVLTAREQDRVLALMSLEALAGWNDDLVHATFAETAADEESPDFPARSALVDKHFGAVRLTEGGAAERRLADMAQARMLSLDWREASQAIAWTQALGDKACVPYLITSLDAWTERALQGAQSLRIRHELSKALSSRRGGNLGLEPGPWKAWWSGVQQGLRPTPGGANVAGTGASFFGVRPESDRIVFVLDRSGSMTESLTPSGSEPGSEKGGAPGVRRWDEAQRQLHAFLRDSPKGLKFNVVLFHSYADSFRDELVPANADQLEELRLWLGINAPGGATMLRSGLERALNLDSAPSERGQTSSSVTPKPLPECDTVVLLCDGETSEGGTWVPHFLDHVAPRLRVVLHGVQVGGQSDGVLEALARGTRGGYVQVGAGR
jgi:hypothetical protein